MSISVEIIGKDRVKAILERVEEGMGAHVESKLRAVADQVKEDAKAICPVDTGSLRSSIRIESVKTDGKATEIGVRAGGYIVNPKHPGHTVDYAVHVEYGTSRRMATPFMRPALLANAENIRRAVVEGVVADIVEAEKA